MPRKTAPRPSVIKALIYPFLLIVLAAIGHYWLHLSDPEAVFFIATLIAWHELDKINEKLDDITGSIELLKESLERLDDIHKRVANGLPTEEEKEERYAKWWAKLPTDQKAWYQQHPEEWAEVEQEVRNRNSPDQPLDAP